MKWLWNFIKRLAKSKLFWFILIIIIIIVVVLVSRGDKEAEYITEKVEKATLTQTVSETGSVRAATEIALNFKGNGTIIEVNVTEGDEVKEGDILARLDAGDAEIQIRQAQANLDIARANLNRLLAGASTEDIQVSEESVNNAKIAYENAKRDYEILLEEIEANIDTYEQAVEAAKKALANAENTYSQNLADARQNLITTIRSKANYANTSLDFIDYQYDNLGNVSNYQAKINTWTYYEYAREKQTELENLLNQSDSAITEKELEQISDLAIGMLEDINVSLDSLFKTISSTIVDARYSQTLIDNYKVAVKSEQTTNSANLSALQNAEQAYKTAQLNYDSQTDTVQGNLDSAEAKLSAALANKESQIASAKSSLDSALGSYNLAKAQLDLKKAPARQVDIEYYQAQVNQAQAALDLALVNLEDYIIRAPTDGKVVFVNYNVGEQFGVGLTTAETKPVITILGKGDFEIEVDVPESEIVKINIGNPAMITLDAYSDEVKFAGNVVFVDLAETNIQDVIYYKVAVNLEPTDKEIKSGMTANVDILTKEKQDVLYVPIRAVKEDNEGNKYVEILSFGGPKKVEVKTGLRGDQGIEIISGLSEGQEVITYKREK